MKYYYFPLLAIVLTGCVKRAQIEFTGSAPGIKNGVFIVKTTGDSTLYGENIKNGKFSISKRQLKYPGYYMMDITDNDHTDTHNPFEVYLEDGSYSVETYSGELYKYPKITSSSKIQEQLSAFYTISDKLSSDMETEVKHLNEQVKKGAALGPGAYNALLAKLGVANNKMLQNNLAVLKQFLNQYPNSGISTHIMAKMPYEDDPVAYYDIYKTLTPAARNSDDGKEVGDRLSHLVKLVPGAKAPVIAGRTPDGKPFDPKTLNKKIIIIDFWRAVNEISRKNHQDIQNIIDKNNGKVGVVSISMDSKADWWTNAIKEDKITWPQVSDLKGDDSQNAVNWNITKIPTYYVLDGQWNILARDIDLNKIPLEVSEYLAKHP